MKTIEKIFDVTTGETTIIESDMSAAEIAEVERSQVEAAERAAKQAEAATAKAALLQKLGITEDEAKLLLG
jgi:tRNA1(Val) A37 N6-methylase TrmN6